MYFGQFSSLDMTVVDLVSGLQIVGAPDKFTFDKPPAKAACRYKQGANSSFLDSFSVDN